MEHLLADKLVTVSVAVRDVGGEGGLAGPVRVPLDDELRAEVGVRSDLLHHHRASLLTQLQWSAQLLALLSKVELDICRTNSQQLNRDMLRRGKCLTNLHISGILLVNMLIHSTQLKVRFVFQYLFPI